MTSKTLRLITTGCSFTAGASGTDATNNPQTWSHFYLKVLQPNLFVNLAMPGAGNFAMSKNLTYFLETKQDYTPDNTQIIFNITGFDRVDTMCSVDHPNANQWFAWAQDVEHNWISERFVNDGAPFNGLLQKHMGFDQIKRLGALSVIDAIMYLEQREFNYYFMFMDNEAHADSPEFLIKFLENRSDRWIQFDHQIGMHDYCKEFGMLINDNFHPDLQGYEMIANFVNQHIKEKL